jgi:hypothetical protein
MFRLVVTILAMPWSSSYGPSCSNLNLSAKTSLSAYSPGHSGEDSASFVPPRHAETISKTLENNNERNKSKEVVQNTNFFPRTRDRGACRTAHEFQGRPIKRSRRASGLGVPVMALTASAPDLWPGVSQVLLGKLEES